MIKWPEPVVTDYEIQIAFLGTNFGHTQHREILNASVMKKMLGYHCGHTITVIMKTMGLIRQNGKPTERGVKLLREAYDHLLKVSG